MAAAEHLDLCITAFAKPPSGHVRSYHNDKEFKYRGTLFRPSSARLDNSQTATEYQKEFIHVQDEERGSIVSTFNQEQSSHSNQNQITQKKFRRIQSAKGRLERSSSKNGINNFKSSSGTISEKKLSILNINAAVDIPDKEEAELMLRANVIHQASNELNHKQRIRPSSAKSTFGCPVSSAEAAEKDCEPTKEILKPSVYGLKLGRQVFGNDPVIQEAWANTEKNYPFKLKEGEETETTSRKSNQDLELSNLPQTLKPLQRWLRHGTHSDVTGLDVNKCVVFLSRDYTAEELQVVPSPQETNEDLPYTCLVATPRKEPPTKYRHPYFENETDSLEWKCSHTKSFDPSKHGDISSLLNPPYRRNPQEIRLEIAELENLMHGIGSLSSDCSFVKFQAEIRCARALARKLILPDASDTQEPTDSFGLLKFYKEHEKAMEIIKERRRVCLEELKLLEER